MSCRSVVLPVASPKLEFNFTQTRFVGALLKVEIVIQVNGPGNRDREGILLERNDDAIGAIPPSAFVVARLTT